MASDPIVDRKKDNFYALKKLFKNIKLRYDDTYFSADSVKAYGVKLSKLDLFSDTKATADGEMQFFEPIPASKFKKFPQCEFEQVVDIGDAVEFNINLTNHFTNELPQDVKTENNYSLLTYSKWEYVIPTCTARTFGVGDGYRHHQEPLNWSCEYAFAPDKDKYPNCPHTVLFTTHGIRPDADVESKIARSELLLLINICMHMMKETRLYHNETYPILMISIFEGKFRLVQGYFDGKLLHLQLSQFFDISKLDRSTFNLLLRWAMADPVGNTEVPPSSVPTKASLAIRGSTPSRSSPRTARA